MNTVPACIVSDFMSSELLYLNEGSRLELAKTPILEFGVTAVPILDEEHRPIGVVSLRDFMRNDERRPQMTSPARSVRADATLAEAARVLAEESLHHVVVIDATGRAVGMLSVLDVLRAVVGLPAAPLRRPFAESEAERAANPSADDESCGIRIP